VSGHFHALTALPPSTHCLGGRVDSRACTQWWKEKFLPLQIT